MSAPHAAAVVPLRRPAHAAAVLWRFSRPHTVVGTALSILGIYAIAVAELPGLQAGEGAGDLALTLLAGLCVNVAIVGVNQVEDVEIDAVNKPHLPIPAGELSRPAARRVVALATVLPLVLAVTQGVVELAGVALALAVGFAYSCPPLRLKRRPAIAALSIAAVRALVVNLVVYLHFASSLGGQDPLAPIPAPVWALTLFVAPFATAIALLKDVPDAEGDRLHRIATYTVRLGARPVVAIALAALSAAYLGMALAGPALVPSAQPDVLRWGHIAALAALWGWAARTDPGDRRAVTRFYLRVWLLFFAEYPLVALAVGLG